MRIAHVTEYCHAGSAGGTERYILDLATDLQRRGHRNEIFWMTRDAAAESAGDLPIRMLPRGEMRVDDPPPALDARAHALLDGADRPDVLHFHTFGRSEARLAALAAERRIPYVFTYHSPGWTCRRETLLLWGEEPCDGEVRVLRCAACKVQERLNSPAWIGYAGAAASLLAGPLLPAGPSSWHRRLAFTPDTAKFRADLRQFLATCRLSVACAEWSIPVLLANGVPRERLAHLPQGVPDGFHNAATPARAHSDTFTVGYIGRMNEVKGIHILVEAFRQVRHAQARLMIYGWSESPQLQEYGRRLRELAGDDARISFIAEKKPAEMPAAYAELSLLAIPSVWMETGPLTLLEALQFGVPVFGSSRIGQRTLLERYGRVVEPNTPAAWARALEAAAEEHAGGRWKPVVLDAPLPTMSDVAARMAELYQTVVAA